MSTVLVLGAGFGGISAALTLRALTPEHDVILVDRKTHFMVGFRKTWAMLDLSPLDDGRRPLSTLSRRGITVRHASVDAIEPETCSAVIDGARVQAGALVVGLGVRHAPEKIPGFAEHALNAYALQDLDRVKAALRDFRGGRIVTGVFGEPYQCPPAPYEIAIMTKEYFEARGIDTDMTVISPKPLSLWAAGEESSRRMDARMAEFGIAFRGSHKVLSVEPGAVVTDRGRLACELAFGVPPCVAVDVVRGSSLVGPDGWIPVDTWTLETRFPDVYAVGDCTKVAIGSAGQMPKAGLIAEKQGATVAHRIAERLSGQTPSTVMDGRAVCYVETGRGEGAVIGGDFLAEPEPDIRLSENSREHYTAKHTFEAERLAAWFGG
ncbi:MAG: NAD(P)/FAD-dependent oxidoreductase [Acidimicrobiia bacterium]|nr:NAD(P)/FAD-dependent oxidoreductase [Acidimicrobiia bacterium]